MQVGWVKIGHFRRKTRYYSKKYKIDAYFLFKSNRKSYAACALGLSNSDLSDDLQWPLTPHACNVAGSCIIMLDNNHEAKLLQPMYRRLHHDVGLTLVQTSADTVPHRPVRRRTASVSVDVLAVVLMSCTPTSLCLLRFRITQIMPHDSPGTSFLTPKSKFKRDHPLNASGVG